MKVYLTDDLFFFEEQVKAWRQLFTGGVTVIEDCTALSDAVSENLLGPCLTVIRQDKLPTTKKEDSLKKLLEPYMESEHLCLFFVKANRRDRGSSFLKAFEVKGMFSFTMEERVDYLDKHCKHIPQRMRFAIAERAEGMDMRSFRSRVLRLEEMQAGDEASIDREFPPLVKGESFTLVPLAEKGRDEDLAKALLRANQILSSGEEAMMVLGTMLWTYRIAYKMAIAPDREDGAKELGLSSFQVNRIPVLSPEEALRRHESVALAGEQIRMGRDGFEALSAVLCKISELARTERGSVC